MTTTRYLWNPINQNIIREYDGAGNTVASYTTEPELYGDVVSQRREGQDSVYHYDGQGSTAALTNANGDVTDTYAYTAFGEMSDRAGNMPNPFQYVGKQQYYFDEETGEHDVRRRPLLGGGGRWLSADPLRETEIAKDGYSYAANNPANRCDPTGMLDILTKLFCLPVVLEPIFGPFEPITPKCSDKGFVGPGGCLFTAQEPQFDIRIKIPDPRGNCPAGFQRVTDTVLVDGVDEDGLPKKKVTYYEWCIVCKASLDGPCKSCIPCVEEAKVPTPHKFPPKDKAGKEIPLIMATGSKYHICGCIF